MEELKTPDEWCEQLGAVLISPDGWINESRNYHEPVNRSTFDRLLLQSTVESSGYPSFSDGVTFVSDI